MNGRPKRDGNGNYGHGWFRCSNRFSKEHAIEAGFSSKMKDEADLEIRRRAA